MLSFGNAFKPAGALIAGPLLLILLGFIFFGTWGLIIGMFIAFAAAVFIPAFAGLMQLTGARS